MEVQDTKGKGVNTRRDGSPPAYPEGHENEQPPSYNEAQHHPPADAAAPPHYGNTDDSPALAGPSQSKTPPVSPYRPFPAVMTLQNIREVSLAAMRSFHLCGADASDVLYAVSVRFGYSNNALLGTKPGFILHNGTDMKAPPLASAGDRHRYFDASGIVVLPALPSFGKTTVEEVIKGGTAADGTVVFWFGVEVGRGEKVRREEFEWRKVKKGAGSSDTGGYELSRRVTPGESAVGGSDQPSYVGTSSGTMAVLAWDRDGSLLNRKREFVLELTGSGLSEALGQRWRLMVVMTALRLAWLHMAGRSPKVDITIQEKLWGREN